MQLAEEAQAVERALGTELEAAQAELRRMEDINPFYHTSEGAAVAAKVKNLERLLATSRSLQKNHKWLKVLGEVARPVAVTAHDIVANVKAGGFHPMEFKDPIAFQSCSREIINVGARCVWVGVCVGTWMLMHVFACILCVDSGVWWSTV